MNALAIPVMEISGAMRVVIREFALYLLEALGAGLRGLLGRVENSYFVGSSAKSYARTPFAGVSMSHDTYESRGVVPLHALVGRILAVSDFAKILYSVVVAQAVLVVQRSLRPLAVKMQPRQAMLAHRTIFPDFDVPIAGGARSSSPLASPLGIPLRRHVGARAPDEDAGQSIVIQGKPDVVRRQFNRVVSMGQFILRGWRMGKPFVAASTHQAQ